METLKYCKVRNVKSPVRAHEYDAGIDFFVPEDLTEEVMKEKMAITQSSPEMIIENGLVKEIYLKHNESVLIPSGIKVKVPKNMMLQFTNKSGIASKKHLLVGANVVDTFYEGECHINVHNVGNSIVTISAGDKIVQGILIPVVCSQTEEVSNADELYSDQVSDRGEGGFGSTGVK